MEDLHRHKGQRNALVKKLVSKGIRDKAVLKAVGTVPRHLFLDSSFEGYAYQDKAFPIAAGQTISQPYTVAFQSEKLELSPGQRVLEVGTGSGYQAAILAQMGMKVYSIERHQALFDHTRHLLRKLGYNVHLTYGDGYQGLPSQAPFDGIVVTAGAPYVPQPLVEQLRPGGRLVIPVGQSVQKMYRLIKNKDGSTRHEDYGDFRFVPLLGNKES